MATLKAMDTTDISKCPQGTNKQRLEFLAHKVKLLLKFPKKVASVLI